MTKQYNVLKAAPINPSDTFPQPYQMDVAPGKWFQDFWLQLEGVEETVKIRRAAGSPVLGGWTWLDMQEKRNKAGKLYYQAKAVQAPDNQTSLAAPPANQSAQPAPVSHAIEPELTWGQALLVAATVTKDPDVQKLTSYATSVYLAPVPDRTEHLKAAQAEQELFDKAPDTLPTDQQVTDINLDDIPF